MNKIKEFFLRIGAGIAGLGRRIWNFLTAHKKGAITAAVVIVLVVAVLIWGNVRHYTNATVRSSIELEDSENTKYLDFQDNILRYSADGAFYTSYSGTMLWNVTYEMSSPQTDTCSSYVIIYDKTGTGIRLMNRSDGEVVSITTNLPIVKAQVAKNGSIAVLMQDGDVGYFRLYNLKGEVIAGGEAHLNNTGYPVDISLSEDGENMAVAYLDLNDGDVKTTLNFYNFGSEGSDADNHIIASYSYSNMVITQVDYLTNDRLVAFGDSEIILFNQTSSPKVMKEIFPGEQMKSIFHDNGYFGYIVDVTDSEGKSMTEIHCYNTNGLKRYTATTDFYYQNLSVDSKGEVVLINDNEVAVYNNYGVEKYHDTLESNVYTVIPMEGSRNYIIIRNGYLEQVKIR